MVAFSEYAQTISPLSEEGLRLLESFTDVKRLSKDELLHPAGHTCRTIYFVRKGALRVFYYKEDKEVAESFEFEGSLVARAESLFSSQPSRKAIDALEDTELISIDAHALFGAFAQMPELETWFRKSIEQAYVQSVSRLESLQFHTAEERYNNLVQSKPSILARVSLKYIASYLGITPVSLSRIRNNES